MAISSHQRDWEELGAVDPLWAVATDPRRKFGRWADANTEFFSSGNDVVESVLARAAELGCVPRYGSALDFGCGVGRLTRALALRFQHCDGVDISASMVATARALNADLENCQFTVNTAPDLSQFDDAAFDFVLSIIVLQHLPSIELMRAYIGEFLRVLRPGGLSIFQVPTRLPMLARAQVPLRLYHLLRGLGVKEETVYGRFGLAPMRMNAIAESEIVQLVARHSGHVLDIQQDAHTPPAFASRTFFVVRDA